MENNQQPSNQAPPVPPQDSTQTPPTFSYSDNRVSTRFSLLNSFIIVMIIFAAQLLFSALSLIFTENVSSREFLLIGFSYFHYPYFALPSLIVLLYLFVINFFIVKFPIGGKYLLIIPVIIILVFGSGFFYSVWFIGPIMQPSIFSAIVLPITVLFFRKKVSEVSIKGFIPYYIFIMIMILILHIGLSVLYFVQETRNVNAYKEYREQLLHPQPTPTLQLNYH